MWKVAACRVGLFRGQQPAPVTFQRLLETDHGRHEDIGFARLDLLHRPYVQLDQFRQALLGYFPAHPLAADIRAKGRKLLLLDF